MLARRLTPTLARPLSAVVAPISSNSVLSDVSMAKLSTAPTFARTFATEPSQLQHLPPAMRPGLVEGISTSVVFTLPNEPGSLGRVLGVFEKYGVNMTHIHSKPSKKVPRHFDITVDFVGHLTDPSVDACVNELRVFCFGLSELEPVEVPWFPTVLRDIDHFSQQTLDAGAELDADHPGFLDEEYRRRRRDIVDIAMNYKLGNPLPRVNYTDKEVETWGIVYKRLKESTSKYAIRSYNNILPLLEDNCGYSETNIPQLEDISAFLKQCTGFRLKPVGGLLSARDFLNGLAFRVFFSTQYIRHHDTPLYTPEPDICHELIGHAPMFADRDFAEFSHDIGLASLGASDEDIKKLATCYWFSVEFGLCKEGNERKAFGAGLLSSFGELEYACAPPTPEEAPEYRPWDPAVAAFHQDYPITTYQPTYYVADNLYQMKATMRKFCEDLNRPFSVQYDPYAHSVSVDRSVRRGQYRVTLQTD